MARSGYEEAIANLRQALEQIPLVCDSEKRDANELLLRVTIGAALAEQLEHAMSLSTAYLFSLQLLECVRDHPAAMARAEQLIAIAERHRFPQWMGPALVLSGASRTALGASELGLKLVDDGLKLQRVSGAVGVSLMCLALAAEAHMHVGNDARALELLSEAIDVSEKSRVGWYRTEVLRLQAEIMLQSGQITLEDANARIAHAAWLARAMARSRCSGAQ